MDQNIESFLTDLFEAAVDAADPMRALGRALPERPSGKTVVIGAGKGAAQLAQAFEQLWEGPLEGVVVTRYGYSAPCKYIRVMEAAHPVPDEAGLAATKALFDAVEGLGPDDLVVALVCGGGSSLLPCPAEGLTFEDEIALNECLLASGAPIGVMNMIRKQISGIKGGRLALAAHPARVVTLVVSDVPGDDPAQVASGPTVPDRTTREAAKAAARTYGIELPPKIAAFLDGGTNLPPLPDDPGFDGNDVRVVASAALSLEAAEKAARAAGVEAVILSDAIEGEAREIARMHAAMARECVAKARPFPPPVVLLSGGETTVTLRAKGRGGRNTEFLLSFALCIDGQTGISALAADTDGIDGSEDNAGAFADGDTAASIRKAGADPAEMLSKNDAWGAFDAAGTLFVPGPTGTNVNDFRAILIGALP
ncbi:glycerate kinase type-2 family protein [Primorskyibacter flagellatus]|uniref:glycerate kinase type-2 family protein n=1 Tax=Primorskyibacter flagellatus TaxID=1387277 RepID=UPI003A8E9507